MALRIGLALFVATALLCSAAKAAAAADAQASVPVAAAAKPAPHHRVIRGKASYYAHRFGGKTMADGKPLNLNSNAAASKTLPLGTTAKVTNLKNGNSAVVRIEDRGPYPPGRVIDVTPKVAEKLDMKRDGLSPVKVETLSVPAAARKPAAAPAAEAASASTSVASRRQP